MAENVTKQLKLLTVYPGLHKLRLEFHNEMWPMTHVFEDSLYGAKVIQELRETYDEFDIHDVLMNVTYKAGRKVK